MLRWELDVLCIQHINYLISSRAPVMMCACIEPPTRDKMINFCHINSKFLPQRSHSIKDHWAKKFQWEFSFWLDKIDFKPERHLEVVVDVVVVSQRHRSQFVPCNQLVITSTHRLKVPILVDRCSGRRHLTWSSWKQLEKNQKIRKRKCDAMKNSASAASNLHK